MVIGFIIRFIFSVLFKLISFIYIEDKIVLVVKDFVNMIRRIAIECSTKAEFIQLIKEYEGFVRAPCTCVKGGVEKMIAYLHQ